MRKRFIRRALYIEQHGLCALCGEPLGDDQTIDHLIPSSKMSRRSQYDRIENLQLAHRSCNNDKADRYTQADLLKLANRIRQSK